MTQTIAIQRCGKMTRTVKLCAEALRANMRGDFVDGVPGVTMTLLEDDQDIETAVTNPAGVVEFATRVTPATMSRYKVRAELGDDTGYQFRGQPQQRAERGRLAQVTGRAYVHKVTFRFEPCPWIAVRVVDATGAVLSGLRVRFTRPNGTTTDVVLDRGALRDDGSHRLSPTPVGQYRISLLELDRELWDVTAAPNPQDPVRFAERPPVVVGQPHVVQAGDCAWSLGVRYGVPASAIWDYDRNAALRAQYPNRDTLLTGATVQIPPVRPKAQPCASGRCHHFVVHDLPRRMKVRFMDRGAAAAEGIEGTVKIAGLADQRVATDGDGAIEFPVPPDATEAKITMTDLGLSQYALALGHLEPVQAPAGVLQRLQNLGFYQPPPAPGDAAARTALVAAVHSFQRSQVLDLEDPAPDGTVGPATRDALVREGGA